MLFRLLDYFSVVAVSEELIPAMKNRVSSMMKSYQIYYGIQATTTKPRCRFYVKKGMKYNSRKDLAVAYYDENDEMRKSQKL